MDYSNFSDEELLKLAKDNGFAEEVSKKIRSTSSREGGVQDPNSAPILSDESKLEIINQFKAIQEKKKKQRSNLILTKIMSL